MEYGLSTRGFVAKRLNSHVLDRILAAGFRQLEIFAARQHFDYRDPNQVRDVAQWFSDHSVALHALHAPLYSDFDWGLTGGLAISVAHLERRLRIDSMDEIKRVLDVAERLPFRYLVLHLGLEEEEYSLEKFDAAFTSIEHLWIFAKERGAKLLLENTSSPLGTPERLLQFLEYTRLEQVGICFDTGHAHLTGDVQEAFRALGDLIASVHLHDNHRERDEHLMPLEGGIEWGGVVRDLRNAPSRGAELPALFELRDHGPEATNLPRLREVIGKLEALAETAAR